jgi:hypothetical protein
MEHGRISKDMIALRDETLGGEPLLQKFMEEGNRVGEKDSLEAMRERFRSDFEALDEAYKGLESKSEFPVGLGPGLKGLQEKVIHEVEERELGES